MRDLYGGSPESQMLRFHTQTSGRALQSEEWDTLNPLRLTYHALMGLLANTNSLHVDSADETITTPSEKWVRQATMIPRYLLEEAQGFVIQNLLSGSYAFRTLVRQVQDGVLAELERMDQLGGVIPATDGGYHRQAIAGSSERYERERRPSRASRPIVGYNAYALPDGDAAKYSAPTQVVRPSRQAQEKQIQAVRAFREHHREEAPEYLGRLRQAARGGGNMFAELLETVRHATLGQITAVLYEVGGRYRKMV
jgi:methylmalonyl-CoA mutase